MSTVLKPLETAADVSTDTRGGYRKPRKGTTARTWSAGRHGFLVVMSLLTLFPLALLVSTLANGLFVRRAVAADFDPEREVATAMNVIGAAVSGRIDLSSNAWRGVPVETAA